MKHQVAAYMPPLYHRGLTTTSGGNISARDEQGVIRVTPAGPDKAHVAADDIVVIGAAGNRRRPSSEFPLHRAIYEARSDVRAIVHAHSPALVAFSLCHELPDLARPPRAAAYCGPLAYVPYAPTGSDELGRRAVEALGPRGRSALLENHGAVTLGASVSEAYMRFECLECSARALMLARALQRIAATSPASALAPLHTAPGPPEHASRDDLCRWAARACERGLLDAATGVLSGRVGGACLMTPPDVDLEVLDPRTLLPATGLHAAIPAAHPTVGAVVEAAPPHATAFALAGRALTSRTIPESMMVLGEVTTIDDQSGLSDAISPARPAVLVAGRGAVTIGRSPAEAFDRLEVLEATARSLIDAHGLGRAVLLDG